MQEVQHHLQQAAADMQAAIDAASAKEAVYQERLAKAAEREQALADGLRQANGRIAQLDAELLAAQAEIASMQDHPTIKAKRRAEAEARVKAAQRELEKLADPVPAPKPE